MSKKLVPLYVRGKGGCLRLTGKVYYRDAGDWYVGYRFKDGELISVNKYGIELKRLSGMNLYECTEEEWRKSNGQYVTENTKAYRPKRTGRPKKEIPF